MVVTRVATSYVVLKSPVENEARSPGLPAGRAGNARASRRRLRTSAYLESMRALAKDIALHGLLSKLQDGQICPARASAGVAPWKRAAAAHACVVASTRSLWPL
jgi:hypothetical protein